MRINVLMSVFIKSDREIWQEAIMNTLKYSATIFKLVSSGTAHNYLV